MDSRGDIHTFIKSRLEIKVAGFADEPVIVARERVNDFKKGTDR
ncbi:MAG: hypothetical protein OEY56_06565 [Cyclobacteriaceae bacterium]|nr:hypothetical protein [Cyclobacteriaceae bacterium]